MVKCLMHLIICLKAELDLPSPDKYFSLKDKKRQGENRGGHAWSFNFVCLLVPTQSISVLIAAPVRLQYFICPLMPRWKKRKYGWFACCSHSFPAPYWPILNNVKWVSQFGVELRSQEVIEDGVAHTDFWEMVSSKVHSGLLTQSNTAMGWHWRN